MTVRCTGSEFHAFYRDSTVWRGRYWEDGIIRVNGREHDGGATIPSDAVVEVEGGVIYCESRTDTPQWDTMEEALTAWLKKRTEVRLVVTVPKAKEAALRDAVRQLGGSVA